MVLDEFGDLDDQEDPAPDPTAEARIQASRPRETGSLAGADGHCSQLASTQEETETRVTPGEGEPPRSPSSRSMGTSGPRRMDGAGGATTPSAGAGTPSGDGQV